MGRFLCTASLLWRGGLSASGIIHSSAVYLQYFKGVPYTAGGSIISKLCPLKADGTQQKEPLINLLTFSCIFFLKD